MAVDLSVDERIALIKSQLQETLKFEIVEDIIRKGERAPVIYWGSATTGRPHCGYIVPMVKIAHFLRAGCHVKVLLADIHGFLDNLKAPIDLVKFRATYYRFIIEALLRAVNVPVDKLEFILGSSYQLTPEYTMDIFRLSSVVTEHDSKRAGAEVVKQVDNAPLSGLIYPLMQALDEEHLGVDAQFGGVDQRKIFILANEQLPKIGYRERTHFMNPMVPGLAGGKMSSSDPDSKIDILETPEGIKKKVKKAFAVPKIVENNGMISFIEYVLLPVSELKTGTPTFTAERRDAEPLIYHDIETLKKDYEADTLTPQLLKAGVADALTALLKPIQEEFRANKEWQDIEQKAYPPPPAPVKKKKEKNLGTRHPGHAAKDAKVKPDGSIEASAGGAAPSPSPAAVAAVHQANVAKDADAAMKKLAVNES